MDLRKVVTLDLSKADSLQPGSTYKYFNDTAQKNFVAKFMANYDDKDDARLLPEFRKMIMLSSEPEVATVYYLATGNNCKESKSCYVMDWIDGHTLQDIASRSELLGFEFIADTLAQIATGMDKAHNYGIAHGDLHEKNIMIDRFGYVKLIDFCWWQAGVTFEKDLDDFKALVALLEGKLSETDKKQFRIIRDYLLGIQSFKDVGKTLPMLLNVSQDLSLMDESSKFLLSVMIDSIKPNANFMHVLNGQRIPVPDPFIPALSDRDEEDMERDRLSKIGPYCIDKRTGEVQRRIDRQFKLKLHQLRQAGFIDGEWGAENTGKKYMGPYVFSYQLFLKSKIFEWKRLNHKIQFLPSPEGTLPAAILQ